MAIFNSKLLVYQRVTFMHNSFLSVFPVLVETQPIVPTRTELARAFGPAVALIRQHIKTTNRIKVLPPFLTHFLDSIYSIYHIIPRISREPAILG
jgi:hypothetical protein